MSNPGWYHDPTNPSRLRFWDGTSWTDRTATLPDKTSTTGVQDRRRLSALAIGGLAVLLVVLATLVTLLVVNGNNEPATATAPASTISTTAAPGTTSPTTPTAPIPTQADVLNANIPGDIPQSCDPADRLDLRDGTVSGSTVLNGFSYGYSVSVAQRQDGSWMIGTGRPLGGDSSVIALLIAGCEGFGRLTGSTLVECTIGRCERLTDLEYLGPLPITTSIVTTRATDLRVDGQSVDVTMTACAGVPGCTSEVQRWEWSADGVQLRSP